MVFVPTVTPPGASTGAVSPAMSIPRYFALALGLIYVGTNLQGCFSILDWVLGVVNELELLNVELT
jgi:hypothetical protein